MSFQDKIEALQGQANKGVITDLDTVKTLIHAYNLRGNTLKHVFLQTAHFRRFWRTNTIDSSKLGTLLTFLRTTAYRMIKMRKL